jgi:fucose permease
MRRYSLSAAAVLSFIAFISLGLPDGLLGVAWPSMRASFSQPIDALGMLLVATTVGYIFSSFFSGAAMKFFGVGRLLALSCAATGTALIGFTLAGFWLLIPAFGILSGLGAGAIDAGLNTYIAEHDDERLMQWLHASFGIGVTLGPLIMTAGLNIFFSWRVGYLAVGVLQIILALGFLSTSRIWEPSDSSREIAVSAMSERASMGTTLRTPGAWLSLLLFFLYTGVELSLGHWTYTLLTESRGVPSEIAGVLTGSFWAMFTLGRFSAGLYSRKLSSPVIVNASIIIAGFGAVLLLLDAGIAANLTAIIVLGLAIAPIFPGLVSSTRHRVGQAHTANTIGMQISAAGLGGSGLPAIAGILARRFGIETIPLFLIFLLGALMVVQIISLAIGRKTARRLHE